MSQRPYLVRGAMGTSDPIGSPGPAEHVPDRSSGPVAQVARDQARLRASQAAVTSDVIQFQLARQRAGLASLETIEPLSAREREVLALLGAGYADGQIADELFISKKTASVHVANIKAKLGAASRVEIALIAARLGLAERPPLTPPDAPASRARNSTVICPFKGLASYEAADARYFFGREPVVAALVARMVGAGMLGLVGPSGSGKSSVIRAGLLPALAEGVLPGSDRWSVGMLRPGATPTAELRAALAAALRRAGVELPERGAVTDALERLPDGVRLIVVADQFEELFTVCDDEADRAVFVDELVQLSRDVGGRAALVVAIRADQYGRCAAYRELAEGLAANHLLIGPMTAEELGRAVELPARSAGLRVEPQLTAALVSAVVGEPGALPLLSTTLLELWQRRDGRTLRLEAYERIGGVSGAVNRIAEAAYARLTDEQQAMAPSVLLRLIAVGDDGSLARRPVAPSTFDAGHDADVERVLAILAESRLIIIGEGRVELAHESLLREWPRLRGWLEDDAGGRVVREHLARAAADWDRGGRNAAELYRGSRLAAAEEWGASHDRELSAVERAFLDASAAEAERELLEQRRTNRRLRVLLGAAAVLLGVALVAAGFAASQQRRVEEAAATGRSRELAASAVAVLEEDPSLAKLLALSAAEMESPPLESIAVLHQALADDRIVFRYEWPEDEVLGGSLWVDLDGEGRRFVASGVFDEPSSHVDLIEVAAATRAWRYTPAVAGVVVGPSFFVHDGANVAVGTAWIDDGPTPGADAVGVRVLDASTGREVRTVDVGPCGGMVVAAAVDHLLVRFVTTPAGEPTSCTTFHREARVGIGLIDLETWAFEVLSQRASVGSHALSLDGRRVAFDEFDGDRQLTVVREIATGESILRVDSFEHDAWARTLSDDGSLLLTGDDPMLVFDVEAGGDAPVARFHGHAGESFHAEFIPGTSVVYSTGRDLTLRSWDARTGEEMTALGGVGSGRAAMAIEADRILVADIETPTVALVDLAPAGEIAAVETCPGFVAAGSLAVVGDVAALHEMCNADKDFLGSLRILDLGAGTLRHTITGTEGQILRLSPDGSKAVYQSSSLVVEGHFPWAGPLVVVDVATGDPILQLDGLCRWDWEQIDRVGRNAAGDCEAFPRQPFPIWTLAIRWSPDGSMIFAADNHNAEGYFAVWDARTGALIHAGSTEGDQKAFDAIFTPDSNELIVARFETGRLDRYSTTTWELVESVELPASVAGRDRVWFAGPTADATTLVAIGGLLGGGGGSLLWLDAETLTPSREPLEHIHDGSVKAVSMSADGSLLATGASGDPIRVWNVATGTLVHEIPIGDLQVQGVAFVDGHHLAFAPETGNVLVVTLDPSELLALARSSLTRGFTPRECERFGFGETCPTLEAMRAG